MKICKQCQGENADELMTCSVCGASLSEEESVREQPAEEAASEQPEDRIDGAGNKKSPLGWILAAILAAVAVLAGLVIWLNGQGPQEELQETPAVSVPSEETVSPADPETGTAAQREAHHVNAYGYASHSIHVSPDGEDAFLYDYMDRSGSLISVTPEEVEAMLDQEVASCAGVSLTNRQLAYYYGEQYRSFLNAYGSYLAYMMDTAKGLDEQISMGDDRTWQQFFVDASLLMFQRVTAVAAEGAANGIVLTAEMEAEADAMMDSLGQMAQSAGYADAAAFLKDNFDASATTDGYRQYYLDSLLANAYLDQLYGSISITDAAMDDYYAENGETLQANYGLVNVDKPVVNVRHILITPEKAEDGTISDEAWTAAQGKAQELYDRWLADGATEEIFAELAGSHTQDPGSQATGGLYNDVYPGQMVSEFNDWCFADGRQTGDHGVVKTSYGYHIMFFSGTGDRIYWRDQVREIMASEQISSMIEALQSKYPLTSYPEKVIVLDRTAPTVPETAETEPEQTAAP